MKKKVSDLVFKAVKQLEVDVSVFQTRRQQKLNTKGSGPEPNTPLLLVVDVN